MNIVPLINETLDGFLLKSHFSFKESIQNALERYDKYLYSIADRRRFSLIRKDERTILSSYGILKFKRRYYFDKRTREYCYLLDNKLQIPKSKRMTNELVLKMLDLASIMSYAEVGKHLSNEFEISKYTVWKTINEISLETNFDVDINRKNYKIHVQIDEKYIGMVNCINKKKYYTLTIFAGKKQTEKNKTQLLNKTVISSTTLKDLKTRLNQILIERYKVSLDEEIFISGDFASYIQNFKDSIYCCRSKYVPDKFHVYKTLRDLLPDVFIDDLSLGNIDFLKFLYNKLKSFPDDVHAKKLRKIIENNPNSFKTYLDKEYLGCSQEAQNSHIYAPRFGKYANRFSPSTIEKLSLIREANVMNATVILSYKKREIPDSIEISSPERYEDPIKNVLDTSQMKYETAKMFNAIKYGRY